MVKFAQATRTAGQINKIVLLAICMAAQQSLNSWPSYRYSNNLHTNLKRNLGQCDNSHCAFKNSDLQIDSILTSKSTTYIENYYNNLNPVYQLNYLADCHNWNL